MLALEAFECDSRRLLRRVAVPTKGPPSRSHCPGRPRRREGGDRHPRARPSCAGSGCGPTPGSSRSSAVRSSATIQRPSCCRTIWRRRRSRSRSAMNSGLPSVRCVDHARRILRETRAPETAAPRSARPPPRRACQAHDLAAYAVCDEILLQRQKRVPRQRQLRLPARRDDQHAHAVQPAREIADQIRRRRIGPVHVVEPEHDRIAGARASSSSAQISRLSRSCEPPSVSAASRAADESFGAGGMICAYQLGASARIRRDRLPSCSFRCRLSSASSTGR